MIIFEQVTKSVGPLFKRRHVLSSVSIKIPTDRRIALVCVKGEDKKTFIELLASIEKPSSGTIIRHAEVSFPVGQLPGFSGNLSVRLNVAHTARLYGADIAATVNLVEEMMASRAAFDRPYKDFPRNFRRLLAQVVAFALPFDLYLLTDDSLRPPTDRARRSPNAAQMLFAARGKKSGMIIPTKKFEYAREVCDLALVLQDGTLELYEDVNEAFNNVSRRKEAARQRRRDRIGH